MHFLLKKNIEPVNIQDEFDKQWVEIQNFKNKNIDISSQEDKIKETVKQWETNFLCQTFSQDFTCDMDNSDNVNNPSHYQSNKMECIDAIEAQLTPEEFRGFLKGNIAKYLWRATKKRWC